MASSPSGAEERGAALSNLCSIAYHAVAGAQHPSDERFVRPTDDTREGAAEAAPLIFVERATGLEPAA